MSVLGIDPGLDGAVALLTESRAQVWDSPVLNVGPGGKVRREHDVAGMVRLLTHALSSVAGPVHVAIESVHAMPGQGVRSMFSMGKGMGVWLGILAALSLSYNLVTPQRWKKAMLDGMGKEKDAARFRALQLFPALSDQLARKKDHGRAEALLLAEYLRRTITVTADGQDP